MDIKLIQEMSEDNFLGILDVVEGIQKEIEISPQNIVIPLIPATIRYPQIYGGNAVACADGRCKAVQFLKTQGVIIDYKFLGYQKDIKLEINLEQIKPLLLSMRDEYKKRNLDKVRKKSAAGMMPKPPMPIQEKTAWIKFGGYIIAALITAFIGAAVLIYIYVIYPSQKPNTAIKKASVSKGTDIKQLSTPKTIEKKNSATPQEKK